MESSPENPHDAGTSPVSLSAASVHIVSPAEPLTLIPMPSRLLKLSRRQFLKLSAAAVALASIPVSLVYPSHIAKAAPSVDEAGPIGKKWVKLGRELVVGAPTAEIVGTPDGNAQYQIFEHGVIIYSQDWGAMLVSLAIFQKWLALNTQVNASGQNLLSYTGFPTQDYVVSPGLETGYFERGMISVQTNSSSAFTVYGAIHEHYWQLAGLLGLPTTEEADAVGGGRFQAFQGGDIYWRGDTRAFEVHGAIRDRWLAIGGSGGPLGYPLSDERPVNKDGAEIGRSSRFENGTVYYSGATGAWEVLGTILHEYENRYSGPVGWLGFPVSGQGTTVPSANLFSNFQQGVLVTYVRPNARGVLAFNKLSLHIIRLQGNTSDCVAGICGSADLFVRPNIQTSTDIHYGGRIPADGDIDGGSDENIQYDFTPDARVVQSDLVVDIALEGWDADDWPNPDDHLGTIHAVYSVDNQWGFFDSGEHSDSTSDGSFHATFSMENPLPYDATQFRQQMWWSFSNFSTPKLTYDQFAAVFTDVDTDEAAWRHPFNALYYELAFKGVADGGNCFGMSLESIFAQVNRSIYSEPIIRFWPDTQDGRELIDSNDPARDRTINELNIKQGYQLGAECIDWFLGKFITSQDHNPRQCFIDSRDAFNRGDYPVISLSNGYFNFSGHTVRPYRWDDSDQTKWIMYIADPNKPVGQAFYADDDNLYNRIEVDPINNTFIFRHQPPQNEGEPIDIWSGSGWAGGRMFYVPFRHINSQPRTPFWEVLALILAGTWLILGDTGQTQQITDANGRSLYEPGLSGPPTRWDQMRQDDSSRVPNITRVPLSNASDTGLMPLEMHYARDYGATYKHEIAPAPGVAAGTPYEYVTHSATLSARVVIPGTPGIADIITTHDVNSSTKAISVTVPANSVSKLIAWTISGPVKQRWLELTNLTLAPGQSITTRLVNGGFEATFENNGPDTTADLRVQAGFGATPVDVGTITIPGGPTTFKFDAPLTTLTYTGGAPGQNGWLVSPITITLTARDYSSKGIASTQYSKDGTNWILYTGPFVLADEGITTLFYRSIDNDGNQEGAQSQVFKIDTLPPTSSLTIGLPQYAAGPSPVIPSITPLTLNATDGSSGVQSIAYRAYLQGSTPTAFTTVNDATTQFQLTGEDGVYTVEYYATDIAGNLEAYRQQAIHLSNARSVNGLQVLYTFEEGSGNIVHDLSGVGSALDLQITNASAVHWTVGGLSIDLPTLIPSSGPASKIIDAVRATNEVTVEAWIQPVKPHEHDLGRITTLSGSAVSRNLALIQGRTNNQDYASYAGRLRTTTTSIQGNQAPSTPPWHVTADLTHVVYARDAAGTARIYINGDIKADSTVAGDLSNWDSTYRFALANEMSGDRPWLGVYQLVAVYNRSLSPAEVRANYAANATGDGNAPRLGLLAQYAFSEGSGQTVHDTAPGGAALDLTIADPNMIQWSNNGLTVIKPTQIASTGPAAKIIDAVKLSGEITIEAWVRPEAVTGDRPANIVSMARDAYNRNAAIDQGSWGDSQQDRFTGHVRTGKVLDDSRTLHTNSHTVSRSLTHIVLTRDAEGLARLFLNGEVQDQSTLSGSLAIWTSSAALVFANDPTGGLPWLGTYRSVTINNRAWSATEVATRFKKGPKVS